ncbi:MAG: hypothetical protein E7551_03695 [Ruminococcaceae bacterium]|nr:hypothetical protein [Oscillospiraceae bacterium]
MNNNQNKNISENAKNFLKQNGIDAEQIKNADKSSLLKNLSPEDAAKINNLLNDKEALNQLLNSDKAKAIMAKLFGQK